MSVEGDEFVTYCLEMHCEGGGQDDRTYAARPTEEECDEETSDWTREGEWGDDGAEVGYWWHLYRETAADWEPVFGPMLAERGWSLVLVEYRGYGGSDGIPMLARIS